MYEGREVYAHAPLVFVTAEVRLGYEPGANDRRVHDAFAAAVRPDLPLLSMEQVTNWTAQLGGGQTQESMPQLRATNAERTVSVTLSANALSVAVVRYDHFDNFRKLLSGALDALVSVLPQTRCTRVGLRYLDEIRVPGVSSSRDWAGWLNVGLLAPLSLLPDLPAEGLSGQLLFHLEQGRTLFRWGDVEGSTVLNQQSPLQVQQPPVSRFFVLDMDSFWEPETPAVLDKEDTLDKFDHLHEPSGRIFQASITERTRELFRGNAS